MLLVRLFTIILLIIAIILVCILLWKTTHHKIEPFSAHPNVILDLNSLLSCSVEEDKDFNISKLTQEEIIYNPRYSSDKIVYIMDGTLTPYQNLSHFRYTNKSIECLHNKTFLCNTKLNKINLLESPIRMIGSGIFQTNLNLNDNSAFYISNQSNSPDKKITIVLYDEVVHQIVTDAAKSKNKSNEHWKAFYDIVNSYNDTDKDAQIIETKEDGTYKQLNEALLYDLLNDSKIIGSNTEEVFKIFIYMCLGIDNSTFKMFKTEKDNWTTDDIKKTFRIVYYKDILYSTDLARWRCKYITEDNATDADDIVKASCIFHDLDSSAKNEDGSNKKKYMSVVDIFILYILQQMILTDYVSKEYSETSLFIKINYSGIIQNIVNNKTEIQSLITGFLDKIASGSDLEKHYNSLLKSTRLNFKHACNTKCDIKLGTDGSLLPCPEFKPKPIFNCEKFTNYREGFQSNSNATTAAYNCKRTCLLVKGDKELSMEICKDYDMRADLYYSDHLLYESERFDRLTTIIRELTLNFDDFIGSEISYAQKFLDNKVQLSKQVCDKLVGLSDVKDCDACKL